MIDSIIFDIDGTLWDSTFVIADAWADIIREHYRPDVHYTAEDLKAQFGKLLPDIAKALFPNLPETEQLDLINRCCEAEHEALVRHSPGVFPGMEETLAQLYEKYPLFIVSNCEAGYIDCLFRATGIGHFFKDSLCPGDTGRPKADNIRALVKKHQLKHPIYVGDTFGDYQATREAGVPFVFAAYGFGQVENPEYIIHKPEDLQKL